MIQSNEIITIMDIVSAKMTNTIATNAVSTASRNCHSKNVMGCYMLQTVLLVIILLMMIVIIGYYYAK